MTDFRDIDFFETGIFTIGEVADLTRIPVARARRWMRGYSFQTTKGLVHKDPLWPPELPQPEEGAHILSFNELIEIRTIDIFCQAGVILQKVRVAIEELSKSEGIKFPFSKKQIITDGSELYSKLRVHGKEQTDGNGRPLLVELGGKQQTVSYDAILTSIVKDLGFEDELVSSFYPDKDQFSSVVVDPRYAFGHPTIQGTRLEVEVVALAYKSNPSIDYVAEWFDVEKDSVTDAVSFHEQFIAA